MSEEKRDYYSIPRMSNSAMSYFKKSPKHYLHYISEKDKFETTAMIFGRAFHCAILEPDKYESNFIVAPEVDGRTKEGKEIMALFKETSKGRGILTANENTSILEMKEVMLNFAPARELFDMCGETEKEIFWVDEITQIEMKGKLDGIGSGIIIDPKTTKDAQPEHFARAAFDYGYHRQAGVYIDGCRTLGIPIKDFYFIAIEKEKPYGITVMKATKEFIQKGREEYENILQQFLTWKNLGMPDIGYEFMNPFNVFDLNLPSWIK